MAQHNEWHVLIDAANSFPLGAVVAGPFIWHSRLPTDPRVPYPSYPEDRDKAYAIGFGRVTGRGAFIVEGKIFIDVEVLSGDRTSGGYAPNTLTVIPNAYFVL